MLWAGALAASVVIPAARAAACDIALLLAIDVSGSVDAGEYLVQTGGLADALADPEVIEALITAEAAVAAVEWSGAGEQQSVIPWQFVRTEADAARLGDTARMLRRSWTGSDTAVGEAIAFSVRQFEGAPPCRRRVIDISGDGDQNAGAALAPARSSAIAAGITINAVAIESLGISITEYYRRRVISPDGFVLTARGHTDYPRAIREKLLREVLMPGM